MTQLCDELKTHLRDSDMLGQVLQHPLVYGVPYFPQMNEMYNRQFKHKTIDLLKAHDAERWHDFVFLHERAYRFMALDELFDQIPDKDFWELFGNVYVDSENVNAYLLQIIQWFDSYEPAKHKQFVMDEGEAHVLEVLQGKAPVRIYRGFSADEIADNWTPSDLSWTTSIKTAQWFAQRFDRTDGAVAHGSIEPEMILAYFNRRGESETLAFAADVSPVFATWHHPSHPPKGRAS